MGFGCPKNAFFTPDPRDNIRKLRIAGKKQLSDCLDFTPYPGMTGSPPNNPRIGEKVFVINNMIRPDTGYTPQQLV